MIRRFDELLCPAACGRWLSRAAVFAFATLALSNGAWAQTGQSPALFGVTPASGPPAGGIVVNAVAVANAKQTGTATLPAITVE